VLHELAQPLVGAPGIAFLEVDILLLISLGLITRFRSLESGPMDCKVPSAIL
jgi:hypothetical protein